MPSSRSRFYAIGAVAVALVAGVVFLSLRREPTKPGSTTSAEETPSTEVASAVATSASVASTMPVRVGDAGAVRPSKGHVVRTLAWGGGEGKIGLPGEEEGEGETPLQLTTDEKGNLLLLDGENDRIVRLGLDGKPLGEIAVPIKEPRDLAVTKDGRVFLLEARGDDTGVTIVGPDGKIRGRITVPEYVAKTSRSVVVSGNDVFVESYRGELTRVADITGAPDPAPKSVPGQPTRDGTGYLNARLVEDDSGTIHVWVVDRESQAERFSRHLRPHVLAEGIFLVDTDLAGTIYIGITGFAAPGDEKVVAELLCLDPASGAIMGAVDLPLDLGAEAILDARALDGGGVVYSVFTRAGVRIEQHDCR